MSSSIYLGPDIHAYTKQVNEVFLKYKHKLKPYNAFEFELCYQDAFKIYQSLFERYPGLKDGFENIYRNQNVIDPEVNDLHIGQLFINLWFYIQDVHKQKISIGTKQAEQDFYSLLMHFGETIQQISNTCIQGVSHRLFEDVIVFLFYDQENCKDKKISLEEQMN